MKKYATSSGFTLIELILVMLVISIVVAMAAPSLRGWSHGMNVRNSAEEFVALTRLARSQAISDATTYRLNVDVTAGQYWLTQQSGNDFVEIASDIGRKYSVPSGGHIEMTNAQSSGSTYFDFSPTGRADPGNVTISDDQKNSVQIYCNSPVENFQIVLNQQTS